jgi:hypothetical protein
MLRKHSEAKMTTMTGSMDVDICNAIHHRKRLEFVYRECIRIVEPYAYGVGPSGHPLLRAYQVSGEAKTGVPAWKLFRMEEVTEIIVRDDGFSEPNPGYQRNDPAMTKIYCEL